MKLSDRRLAQRFSLTIPLYIRAWKSHAPEQKVESVNVSECGAYFQTDTPPREGAMIQIRLKMPMEVTGNPAVEWNFTGKVTRIKLASSPSTLVGVSVRFDYNEVSRSTGPLLVPPSGQNAAQLPRNGLMGMWDNVELSCPERVSEVYRHVRIETDIPNSSI
jgi:hypothetical protein